ncbi:MAG: acyltransferase [Actinomycetota bacterium]|nr:acyltransferase [Actinomycetota bacterium]
MVSDTLRADAGSTAFLARSVDALEGLVASPPTVSPARPAEAPGVSPDSAVRDGHLWQVDIIRLLTFAAVILVHALAFTEEPTDGVAAGLMMVLQFGREVFFALTGFVLVYSCMGRTLRARSFWRKRFLYVGVPYVVWTVVYYGFSFVSGPHPPFSWATLGDDLINGNAEYHLYFLLVSMELYLVFPLVMRFVRATAHRALLVLAVVGSLNVAWLAALQWFSGPSGWGGFLWTHAYELLPTYAIYVLAGCYTAVHLEKILAVLRANRRRLIIGSLGGLLFTEMAFLLQTMWMDPRSANNPLQPAMIVCSASVVILLAVVGDIWASGNRAGLPAIRRASDISFGVYLLHPVILTLLCNAGLGNNVGHLPSAAATALAVPGTAVGAVVVCLMLRRSPFALPLIGRAWVRPDRQLRSLRENLAQILRVPADPERSGRALVASVSPLCPSDRPNLQTSFRSG